MQTGQQVNISVKNVRKPAGNFPNPRHPRSDGQFKKQIAARQGPAAIILNLN